MNESKIEDKIIAYFEGEITQQEMDALIKQYPEAQQVYDDFVLIYQGIEDIDEEEPPVANQARFDQWLESQKTGHSSGGGSVRYLFIKRLSGIAAIGILLLSAYLAFSPEKSNVDSYAINEEMKSFLESSSSSERIRAINVSADGAAIDNQAEIIALLSYTLENDPSSNVRLAAVEALADYVDHPEARTTLISALSKDRDGAVKVAAINALSNFNNQEVIETFEKITKDKSNDKFVIDEAHIKLLALDQY